VVKTAAAVKRVSFQGNRASGVELADGTRIDAGKAVITNVEPNKSFLEMVGEERLPPAFATRVAALPLARTVAVLHAPRCLRAAAVQSRRA
jgi:hypothetical protein